MLGTVAAILFLFVSALPVLAANLGAPALSPPLTMDRFFDPDRLISTGGVKYSAADDLFLEPEWGVCYHTAERAFSGGIQESHRLNAQAGWRLSLADSFYLSAAAKLPILSVESAGRYTGQDLGTRHGYDFTRPLRLPTWTGEVGIHFTPRADLTVYYDQGPAFSWLPSRQQQEERVGTRIILRFD